MGGGRGLGGRRGGDGGARGVLVDGGGRGSDSRRGGGVDAGRRVGRGHRVRGKLINKISDYQFRKSSFKIYVRL